MIMTYRNLRPEDLQGFLAQHPDATLLDVRGQDEWEAGHLPNAVLMPHWFVALKIYDVVHSLDAPIVVYCRSGARASLAAQTLDQMGYSDVHSLLGGFDAYQALV